MNRRLHYAVSVSFLSLQEDLTSLISNPTGTAPARTFPPLTVHNLSRVRFPIDIKIRRKILTRDILRNLMSR